MPKADSAMSRRPASSALRIASNYTRLLASFLIGLFVVRLLLGFGSDAYGLILLITAVSGVMIWLREALSSAMMPALGDAYHQGDDILVGAVYNSSLALAATLAIIAFAAISSVGFLFPYWNIPSSLISAAWWLLLFRGLQHAVSLLLTPPLAMLLVTERMVAHNVSTLLLRIAELAAVAGGIALLDYNSLEQSVIGYAILSAGLAISVQLGTAVFIARDDERLRLDIRAIDRTRIVLVSKLIGWNSLVTIANNLYLRVDALIMNIFFGLFGNMVFGVAMQFSAYVRQLTIGLLTGLDATASRLANTEGMQASQRLLATSTRWQSAVVFPSTVLLITFTQPILNVWIGERLDDPTTSLPAICQLVRWLLIGIAARSLAEGWMKMLSGQGAVHKYAKLFVAGASLNPILVIVLLALLPPDLRMQVPAACYAVLGTIVYLLLLPRVIARHVQVDLSEVFSPMLRPLLASAVSLAGVWTLPCFHSPELLMVGLSMGVYGLIYSGFFWFFIVERRERERITNYLRDRFTVTSAKISKSQAPLSD